jgi:hypothetical protein
MQESARDIDIQPVLQPTYVEVKATDEIEVFFLNRSRKKNSLDTKQTMQDPPNPETMDVDTQLQHFGY